MRQALLRHVKFELLIAQYCQAYGVLDVRRLKIFEMALFHPGGARGFWQDKVATRQIISTLGNGDNECADFPAE